jgi:hypothetical protein
MSRRAAPQFSFILTGFLLGFGFFGCDKAPARRLTDPTPEGAVSQGPGTWVLYDEDLRTGGGYYLIPNGGNQTLVAGSEEFASSGRKSIFYAWNGKEVLDSVLGLQHLFAGFGLLVAEDITQVNTTAAKDLSAAGFTKITFMARGSLSENTVLRVEGPGDGSGATILPRLEISRDQLTGTWTKFTLPASGAISSASFKSVKQYLNFTMVYSQPSATTGAGEGGSIYIDQITYEK